MPFSIFLKSYFSQHSKYGSKDRKRIAHLCYCCFRLGHALKERSISDRVMIGLFLCNQSSDPLLQHERAQWNESMQLDIDGKIHMLQADGVPFQLNDIFPWRDALSGGIDHLAFCRSMLVQPDVFLRLRPGNESRVLQKLQAADMDFEKISSSCVSLRSASSIDKVIGLDKEAVVQDKNSQRVGEFFMPLKNEASEHLNNPEQKNLPVWDCCAASGGKSILAYDLLHNIQLTVSDIRASIIENLIKRFAKARINNYRAAVLDLTKVGHASHELRQSDFDLIICDAPCSGSGTWGRTPEQLAFFNTDRIAHYANLQKTIASNAIPGLKKGGRFVYITCSVFKKENEDTVAFLRDQFSLQPERMEVLKGYDQKADTLFATSFTL